MAISGYLPSLKYRKIKLQIFKNYFVINIFLEVLIRQKLGLLKNYRNHVRTMKLKC